MKKATLLILILLLSFGLAYADNISIIEGTWNRRSTKEIKLFRVEDGALKEMASSQLLDNGKFYFAFVVPREAFYVIGLRENVPSDAYTFYFKPGDCLNVTINDDSYVLTRENTPENKEMEKWHNFIFPIEQKSLYFMKNLSNYVDFFPLLDEKLEMIVDYKVDYTSNATFSKLFESFRKFDLLHDALMLLTTPRSAHPQKEDFPDYYRDIELSDITSSDALLSYPYGLSIVSSYGLILPAIKFEKYTDEQMADLRNPITSLKILLPEIKDEKIKGEIVLRQTSYLKSYDGFLDFEKQYGEYLITDNQKERLKSVIKDVANLSQGQVAVDFKFPDINGKEVALSDFKGKIVYIDIWATWCGPCVKEIPHLKKLEEEYHGKDIVFLSVSTDGNKDIQKWKDFIKSRELKGIQLFAGDKSKKELLEPYKISGIPKFILIGKDGKLITVDAPRPSNPEIKVLLNATLKK